MRLSGVQVLVLSLLGTVMAYAQIPVIEPERIQMLDHLMNESGDGGRLKCEVQVVKPFLDFSFRYEAGYVGHCALAQFEGRAAGLGAYLRIHPSGKTAVYLADKFDLPEMPASMRPNYRWRHLREEAEFSGVFAAGPGEYQVDLAIVDDRSRFFQKHWQVRIEPSHRDRRAEIAIGENTVDSTAFAPWHEGKDGSSSTATKAAGPQITVLLDAAPIYPASQKLRAWDSAFLMTSLNSLLRGVRPSTVRLIAFNLEQQREVFHEEVFGREQFAQLGQALKNLELGTISYRTLQAQGGWAELLTSLIHKEARGSRPSDAVVFLGPNVRNLNKIPRELLSSCESLNSRIFYLEFFPIPGYEFPDTIHQLTNTCRGNVFKLHSPGDLAEAINKLQVRLPVSQAAVPGT